MVTYIWYGALMFFLGGIVGIGLLRYAQIHMRDEKPRSLIDYTDGWNDAHTGKRFGQGKHFV